jgi:hypothetical protein
MSKSKKQTAGDKPKSKTEADLFAAFTDFCKVILEGLTLPDKSGGRTVDCCYVETLNSKLAEISSSISIFLETDNTGGTDKRLWEHSLMALWFLSDNVRSKGTDSFYFEPNQKITAEKIARVENAWQLLKAEQPTENKEHSLPLGVKQWAFIFGISKNKLRELRENKMYHFRQVSSHLWTLPKNELPAEYLEKYRQAISQT